jgi:hypothetical protein
MKYTTLVTKDRERDKITEALPDLKADWLEVRQWTIRQPAELIEKVEPIQPNDAFPEFPVDLDFPVGPAIPNQEIDLDDPMSFGLFLPLDQPDSAPGSWNGTFWPFN